MPINFKVSILPTADNTYSLGSASSRWQLNGVLPPTFDTIYPVGSIYMSVNSTSPATLFGGTWEQITGRFLLACDTTYTAGTIGGSAEIPYHRHNIAQQSISGGSHAHASNILVDNRGTGSVNGPQTCPKGVNNMVWSTTTNSSHSHTLAAHNTDYAGNSSSTNNMPPYLAVYVWKRTA